MEGIIVILIIIGILKWLFSSGPKADEHRDASEQRFYKGLYRDYYGKNPDHRISRREMAELDELDDEEYEDE